MNLGISSKELAIILVNVAFSATFLTIFFFTYASKVEKEVVMNNMSYLTTDLLRDVMMLVPENKEDKVIAAITSIKTPDMSAEDNETEKNNKKIFTKAVTAVSIGLFVVLIVTYNMSRKNNFNYSEVIYFCLATVCVIALVEFLFLRLFASKYLAADANFVKYTILDTLQNYGKN